MLRKVYELEGLLQNLESHLAGRKPDFAMSDAITSNFLSQSAFDYERNTRSLYLHVCFAMRVFIGLHGQLFFQNDKFSHISQFEI